MKEANDENCPDCMDASRRRFIKRMAASAAAVTLLGAAGCSEDEPEMRIGTLKELKEKGSLSPKFNGNRILATQRKEAIVIFSLVCSHKACTVKWKADKDLFACPCHEGKYDREGNVTDGPPPGPLKRYAHEVRGEELWVLNKYIN